MPRLRVALVLCAAAALPLAAQPASAQAPPSCFPARSKTVVATKTARVFETRRGTYGCLYRYGQARRLDPGSERLDRELTAYKPFRFAGPYVAFPRLVSQGDGPNLRDWTEVVVADLRPSRPLILQKRFAADDQTLRDFNSNSDEYASGEAFVTDLVLQPDGVVGWIECAGYTIGPCDTEKDASYDPTLRTAVFAAAPRAHRRTKLDQGARIDKTSLVWARGKFHWRNAGELRSARFG
jgi:hypothetical protein